MGRFDNLYWYVEIKKSSGTWNNLPSGTTDHFSFSNISKTTGYGVSTKNIFDQDLNISSVDQSFPAAPWENGLGKIQDFNFSISNLNFWFDQVIETNSNNKHLFLGQRVRLYICNGFIPGLIWTGAQWEDFDAVVPGSPPANPATYYSTDVFNLLFDGTLNDISIDINKVSFKCDSNDKKRDVLIGTLSDVTSDKRDKGLIIPIHYGDLTDKDAHAPVNLKNARNVVPVVDVETQALNQFDDLVVFDKLSERSFEVQSLYTVNANKNQVFFSDDSGEAIQDVYPAGNDTKLITTPTPLYLHDLIKAEQDKTGTTERNPPVFKIEDELINYNTLPQIDRPIYNWDSTSGYSTAGILSNSRGYNDTTKDSHAASTDIDKISDEITKLKAKISADLSLKGLLKQHAGNNVTWNYLPACTSGNVWDMIKNDGDQSSTQLQFFPMNGISITPPTDTNNNGSQCGGVFSVFLDRLGFSGTIESLKFYMSAEMVTPEDSDDQTPVSIGGDTARFSFWDGSFHLKATAGVNVQWGANVAAVRYLDNYSDLADGGDIAGTITVENPGLLGSSTLDLEGFTAGSGTINAGVRLETNSGYYVITAAATIASNKATVSINPKLFKTISAASAVTLTVGGDAYQFAYFPDGFGDHPAAGTQNMTYTNTPAEAGGTTKINTLAKLYDNDSLQFASLLCAIHDDTPDSGTANLVRTELEIWGMKATVQAEVIVEDKLWFARLKGRDSGGLLEDPTDVIENLINTEYGTVTTNVKTTARTAWKVAGSIWGKKQKLRDLIRKLCYEFALMVFFDENDELNILDFDKNVSADHTITESDLLLGSGNLAALNYNFSTRGEIYNRFEVRYKYVTPTKEYAKVIYIDDQGSNEDENQLFESITAPVKTSLVNRCVLARSYSGVAFGEKNTKVIELDFVRDDTTAENRLIHAVTWNTTSKNTVKVNVSYNFGYNIKIGEQADLNLSGYPDSLTGPRYLVTGKRVVPSIGGGSFGIELKLMEIAEL